VLDGGNALGGKAWGHHQWGLKQPEGWKSFLGEV